MLRNGWKMGIYNNNKIIADYEIFNVMRKNVFFIFVAILLASCSKEIGGYTPVNNPKTVFRFNNTTVSGSSSESIQSLAAYIFTNDVLESIHEDILINDDNITLDIMRGANKKLFFLANATINPEYLSVGKTSFNALKEMTTEHLTSTGTKTDFMSCVHELSDNNIGVEQTLDLLRATARLDMDVSVDALIEVDGMSIENVPAETFIIEQDGLVPSGQTIEVKHTFDTPITGYQEDILRLFESSSPVKVTLDLKYGGVPMQLHAEIPELKRNHKYKLRIKNIGSKLDCEVFVSGWENGGIIEGFPDVNAPIYIDLQNTEIPSEGVTVNREEKQVIFPKEGGEIVLAFDSFYPLDVLEENPSTHLSVERLTSQKFRIKVDAQKNGDDVYTVRLKLKPDIVPFYYDYVDLIVETHPLHSVSFGGVEWMSFNSFGSSLKNQVFPSSDVILNYYKDNWSTCLGLYYQWGRLEGSTPWLTAVDTPLNGDFLIWNIDGIVPCPAGYRLPTLDEFQMLLPPGKKTSGGWYVGDDWVSVAVSKPDKNITINGVSVTPRSLQLSVSSLSGKNKLLIFPFSGYKAAGSSDGNPDLGNKMAYWVANRELYGMMATRVELNVASGVITYNDASDINDYAAVRCVKDTNF